VGLDDAENDPINRGDYSRSSTSGVRLTQPGVA
jgi:hypothetical protein